MNDPKSDFTTITQDGGEVDLSNPLFFHIVKRERARVNRSLNRAITAGTEATLTLVEWLQILHFYKWKCAYCRKVLHLSIDHVIPVSEGGGTTRYNCVPACLECQTRRNQHYQDTKVAQDRLEALFPTD